VELGIGFAALALGVVNTAILVLALREIGSLKQIAGRRSGLSLNSQLPEFNTPTLAGGVLHSADLRQRLLLFVSPDCPTCHDLLRELEDLPEAQRPPTTVAISSKQSFDPGNGGAQFLNELAFVDPSAIFVDEGRRVFSSLRVPVTPFVYVLGPDGRVRGSGMPKSAGELIDLAQAAV
jgi:hypothetical protein